MVVSWLTITRRVSWREMSATIAEFFLVTLRQNTRRAHQRIVHSSRLISGGLSPTSMGGESWSFRSIEWFIHCFRDWPLAHRVQYGAGSQFHICSSCWAGVSTTFSWVICSCVTIKHSPTLLVERASWASSCWWSGQVFCFALLVGMPTLVPPSCWATVQAAFLSAKEHSHVLVLVQPDVPPPPFMGCGTAGGVNTKLITRRSGSSHLVSCRKSRRAQFSVNLMGVIGGQVQCCPMVPPCHIRSSGSTWEALNDKALRCPERAV